MEIALLVAAYLLGLAARAVNLPPLVGYLVAGFALHALGYEFNDGIDAVADIGVLLLLFGIGLKLRLNTLLRTEVWGTATAFGAASTVLVGGALLAAGAIGIPLARDLDLRSAAIVGFALSFSSTVFAVKALERTNEGSSVAGRLAIGVLILQDVFAVAFLVGIAGQWPSAWALLVVPGIVILRPVFGWLLDRSGHGEVIILLGFALAVGIGAGVFDRVGLKADLGALVAGLMLSRHPRAGELADRLLAFKDLFLVGFFLSIGLAGTPSPASWALGLGALVLVPTKGLAFFGLFTRFRSRARTGLHAALTLSTYSEFGLIVAAAAVSEGRLDQAWVSTIAVAVATSFVVASVGNASRYRLYGKWSDRLVAFERHPSHPDDAIVDGRGARILVFGMGRVGTGAYDGLVIRRGHVLLGIDRSDETVAMHSAAGRAVVHGDALDRDFWERFRIDADVELVIASMNNHGANLECVRRVREFLPTTRIAAIAAYPDEVAELQQAGVDVARNLYEEAGQALADDATQKEFGSDA